MEMANSKEDQQERKRMRQNGGGGEKSPNCPRCESANTKFCYYNNYSLAQPRFFCKSCRRYWTKGGTLRNVPVGGSCRKNKKSHSSRGPRFQTGQDDPIIINPSPPSLLQPPLPPFDIMPPINATGLLGSYGFQLGSGFLQTPTNGQFFNFVNVENGSGNPYEGAENGGSYPNPRDDQEDQRANLGFPWHLLGGDNEGGTTVGNSNTTSDDEGFGPNFSWQGMINTPLT
ncbi:unnamed protein product [Cuscuta epithymum]|uniref:Dof zinc finger protein n=1 Tax=Cuscuta epithymum TaxID=186058 RepID=A0AAV0CEJ6_9ASTE|nr:unnamed protein product [Cuscuta epithymum]